MVQPGRVPSPVFVMGRMPGADGVEVWLGALDGVYTLVDPLGAATVERFAPYQRVDDRSPFLACARCGPRADHYAAGMSSVTALETGVASVQLRGEAVRVIGTATSTARAEVWIDGALAARVGSVSHPDPAVLAEVGGLGDGWHDVEVRGTAAGIGIDAVEASGEGGREGGGCGGGSVAGVGVMVLGGGRRRDRRTAGASASLIASWEA